MNTLRLWFVFVIPCIFITGCDSRPSPKTVQQLRPLQQPESPVNLMASKEYHVFPVRNGNTEVAFIFRDLSVFEGDVFLDELTRFARDDPDSFGFGGDVFLDQYDGSLIPIHFEVADGKVTNFMLADREWDIKKGNCFLLQSDYSAKQLPCFDVAQATKHLGGSVTIVEPPKAETDVDVETGVLRHTRVKNSE